MRNRSDVAIWDTGATSYLRDDRLRAAFSFHPLKNMSTFEGGMITTNDPALYSHLLRARNHGLRNRDECDFWSFNSRLDTIQAAMLLTKLERLPEWTEKRRQNAAF